MRTSSMLTVRNSGGASGGGVCGAHELSPMAKKSGARQITAPGPRNRLRKWPASPRRIFDIMARHGGSLTSDFGRAGAGYGYSGHGVFLAGFSAPLPRGLRTGPCCSYDSVEGFQCHRPGTSIQASLDKGAIS